MRLIFDLPIVTYLGKKHIGKGAIILVALTFTLLTLACQKTITAPNLSGVAALTVVNTVPNSASVIPVIDGPRAIEWFASAQAIVYGGFAEYSPLAGHDSIYIVQGNGDTLNDNAKSGSMIFEGSLTLAKGGIYSLFLCGSDTISTDYLFTTDSLPNYPISDSVMGIRFVNLSAGSNPISINLEGSPNGSEVGNLPYKGITSFKQYANNSTTVDYIFVIRDAVTGDSLVVYDFLHNYSINFGFGLVDPNTGSLLTFKNLTIAIYGSETNSNYPLNTVLIDDY